MKIENEEVTFNGQVIFNAPTKSNVIPLEKIQKFIATDTTPTVLNQKYWQANNAGAITVTQFDNGGECQEIIILGDNQTTVANNANIKTNTGANKLLATNRVYRFVRLNSIWYEQ
jgi:hypothetical protein